MKRKEFFKRVGSPVKPWSALLLIPLAVFTFVLVGKLQNKTPSTPASASEEFSAAGMTGAKKVQVVLLKWKTGTGGNDSGPLLTETQIRNRFAPVSAYIKSQSYGRLTLDTVEVHDWKQTNIPFSCAGTVWGNLNNSNPIDDWIVQNTTIPDIGSDGIRIVVMNNPNTCATTIHNTGWKRPRVAMQAFVSAYLEKSLTFALGAGNAVFFMNCPVNGVVGGTPPDGGCYPIYFGSNVQVWDPTGDANSAVGTHHTNISAWHRDQMGWLAANQVKYIRNDSGPIDIQPLNSTKGVIQNVQVCIDNRHSYSIENRVKAGFDAIIPHNAFDAGVVWLTEINDPNDNAFPSGGNFPLEDIYRMGFEAWPVGSVLDDQTNKIKIKIISKNSTTNVLRISVDYYGTPPEFCPPKFPVPPVVVNPPTLTTPVNNAPDFSDATPTFSWNSVSGAAGYHIQVDDANPYVAPLVVNNPNITSGTLSFTPAADLPRYKTYYWKVRAKNSAGVWSGWSELRALRILNPPVTLLSPANGTPIQDRTPLFTWNSPPAGFSAAFFQIQVDDTNSFATPVINNPSLPGTQKSFTPSADLNRGVTYYWRVRYKTPAGQWSAWTVRSFTVI